MEVEEWLTPPTLSSAQNILLSGCFPCQMLIFIWFLQLELLLRMTERVVLLQFEVQWRQ